MTLAALDSDDFEPVRPATRSGPFQPLKALLAARRDLLSYFADDDYRVAVRSFRLVGRQFLIVNDPAAIKHFMTDRHDNYERKTPQMLRSLEPLLGDGLFISDGETWSHRRPLVADIVHKGRLPQLSGAIETEARAAADRWAARSPGQSTDALKEMAVMAACIVSRAVFNVPLAEDDARLVVDGFAEYQARIDSINLGFFLGFDRGLPIWLGPKLRKSVKDVRRVVGSVIDAALQNEGLQQKLLERLAQPQEYSPPGPLSRDALRDEAATLFMAGYETTASTLAWAWYLLAGSHDVRVQFHSELERVLGGRDPTSEDVSQLPFCRAIIEETLRLYPPVPFLGRQALTDDQIGPVRVEATAIVLASPWLLHRSPDLWSDPNAFRPDRFLKSERPVAYSYIPFAAGPRICPGMNFGLLESVLCLATLGQRFDLKMPSQTEVSVQCRLTLRPRGGLAMHICKREAKPAQVLA